MKRLDPLEVPLSGTQLIEASAGTGKTYTITTLYLRLVLERRLTVEQILVVTFTKAAAGELRHRIRSRLREAATAFEQGKAPEKDTVLTELLEKSRDRARDALALAEAIRNLDESAVFTIHGFCQRMLSEFAFESNVRFDVELVPDLTQTLHELGYDFWSKHVATLPPEYVSYLRTKRFGIPGLVALAHVASSWPDMPLVNTVEPDDPDGHLRRYLQLKKRCAELWRSSKDDILRTISVSPAINRNAMRESMVPRIVEALDVLFSRQEADLSGWSELCDRLSEQRIERSMKKGYAPIRHAFFSAQQELCDAQQAASEAFDAWLLRLKSDFVEFVRVELTERKQDLGVQSFDDLLYRLRDALVASSGRTLGRSIRERHSAALIDEFQDTDPVQYEIFRRVYGQGDGCLFLIGDPKQAIYAFRGADIFSYIQAARDAGENAWTLDVNYRSDPTLIRALNAAFSRLPLPFLFDEIRYTPVSARPEACDALVHEGRALTPFELLFVERTQDNTRQNRISTRWADEHLATYVAADIAAFLSSGAEIVVGEQRRRVEPRDVAVLTRTNRQAQELQAALRQLRIPSVLHGDSSVLDSSEASDLGFVMRAVAEPTGVTAVRSALATSIFGVSADELCRLNEDEAAWEAWVESFRSWHETWQVRGFVQAIQRLMRDHDVSGRSLVQVDGERRLTNLRHLTELLHEAETTLHLGIVGLLQWFDEVRFDQSARQGMAPDAQQIRLESDDLAVQLTTMHKAKGLEFPVVYCPYLWGSGYLFENDKRHLRYHDPDDQYRLKLDLRDTESKASELAAAEREALAESLRLLYVALTRARHRVVVLWGAFQKSKESALGYLLHQPRENFGGLSVEPQPRVDSLSDTQIRSELETIARAADGAIALRTLRCEPGAVYHRVQDAELELSARVIERTLSRERRTSSFSALTARHQISLPAQVGRDVDEVEGEPSELRVDASVEPPAAPRRERVLLADFPRGAKTGDLLHSILELYDFCAGPDALRARTAAELARHGFDAERWTDTVANALGEVLRTPLPLADVLGGGALTLDTVPQGRRLSELEFTFPVAEAGGARRLTAKGLAEVFSRHARGTCQSYAEQLRSLAFPPLAGFLRGFVDLVFEHDGRFYVADYKSNHLGDAPSDYGRQQLEAAMAEHHYYLQYHVYAVALHRYLKARVENYDYERHFGGSFYLFLRGMSPGHAEPYGVFFDRPERALIEGLSQAFSGTHREVA